eukprot:TRINITY_DN715_c0_g1_i3.p1 TRINITY_DN715_c0_g1~~TRINITY_DN715_c0_g1_i3.p1  ORF type:complete len:471 (-),score=58.78 TRINITY_DN715_c0_g1_i3:1966-3378(-)
MPLGIHCLQSTYYKGARQVICVHKSRLLREKFSVACKAVNMQQTSDKPIQQQQIASTPAPNPNLDFQPYSEKELQDQEFCIVNFYHLVDIEHPEQVVTRHKNYVKTNKLDIRGRIYISHQGINAQFGGAKTQAVQYAEWVQKQPEFKNMTFRTFAAVDHSFPKLRLQFKPNLISLQGGIQDLPVTRPEQRAKHVGPEKWREMLEKSQQNNNNDVKNIESAKNLTKPILLDVRNNYEWDAGHFEGAQRPQEAHFNETEELPYQLKNADKNSEVMMYCTGGIRCDIFSTVLRKNGFNNLYTLDGGIQNYLQQEKSSKFWNGSLFVFDSRLAITPDDVLNEQLDLEGKQAAVACQLCRDASGELPHLNCANIDCNQIFVACATCKKQFKGCCCYLCQKAPRLLRPMKQKGNYGNWASYSSDEEGKIDPQIVEKMKSGRGMGRTARRRRRKQKQIQIKMEERQVFYQPQTNIIF